MSLVPIKKAAVIGAGSWGTVVANLLASNVAEVVMWARDSDVVRSINTTQLNQKFLPDLPLAKNLRATESLEQALTGAQLMLWAIPVQYTRERLKNCAGFIAPRTVAINLSKGLEMGTWYRPSQIMTQECPMLGPVGSLGGPNIASEVARGQSACATLAMTNHWETEGVDQLLATATFRVTLSADLLALELAGALKNVVAIAAGICDGLGLGENAKADIVAQGFEEIRVIGRALGANPDSFNSPYCLGDLLATCYSRGSRNRSLGEFLGKQLSLAAATQALSGRVAEGVVTTKACSQLGRKLGLSLPLIGLVDGILDGVSPAGQVRSFNRQAAPLL